MKGQGICLLTQVESNADSRPSTCKVVLARHSALSLGATVLLQIRSARAELEAQAAQARVSELEKDVAHQRSLAEQIAEKNSQHEQQLLAEADRRAASITADSNRKIDQVIAENTALQSTLTSAKYESARQDQELRSRIAETQNELKSAYNSVRERYVIPCCFIRSRL